MEFKLTVGHNGGVILPALYRKKLNLKKGDQVIALLDHDNVRITSLQTAVKDFQQVIKQHNFDKVSLVESLKQSRTEEKDE